MRVESDQSAIADSPVMPVDLIGAPRDGWIRRLWSGRLALLLIRNTVVSCTVFLFGLALLWVLVERGGMNKLGAAALGFLVANTIHYAFCRLWIFPGSDRPLSSGYMYFFINSGIGLVSTIILFDGFMALMGSHYIAARIVASILAGLTMFLLNAILNFKCV
jgi:putative flippase GtrA